MGLTGTRRGGRTSGPFKGRDDDLVDKAVGVPRSPRHGTADVARLDNVDLHVPEDKEARRRVVRLPRTHHIEVALSDEAEAHCARPPALERRFRLRPVGGHLQRAPEPVFESRCAPADVGVRIGQAHERHDIFPFAPCDEKTQTS